MPPQFRIDQSADDESSPHILAQLQIEKHRLEGLTRAQAIQLFGMEMRNAVAKLLTDGRTVEDVAQEFVIRGKPTLALEIIESAMHMEEQKKNELPDANIQRVLEQLILRAGAGDVSEVNKNVTLIPKMAERIVKGESLRGFDLDLTEENLQELLLAIPVSHQRVVLLMLENNRKLHALLDQHPKFSSMLNAPAFVRKVDEKKETNGVYVYADFIGFKACNSHYTVDFVDATLLKHFTTELRNNLPQSALVGIKGGDEFMIYMEGESDTKHALQQIARIMQHAFTSVPVDLILKQQHLLNRNDMTMEEAERIADHYASLHAKLSGMEKQSGQTLEQIEPTVTVEYKKVDTEEMKQTFRFPAIDAADAAKDNAVFGAVPKTPPVLMTVPFIKPDTPPREPFHLKVQFPKKSA